MPGSGSIAPAAHGEPTWLCPDSFARQRLLDGERHMRKARMTIMALMALSLVALAPWEGFETLVPLAIAMVGYRAMDRRVWTSAKPEYWLAGVWALTQLALALAVGATGGPESPFIAWLALAVATLPARFNERGVLAGVAWTAFLMVVMTVGVDAPAVFDEPGRLVACLTLLAGVAILSRGLMRSDIKHRAQAVIDPLTGLMNRHALEHRASQLAEEARSDGAWISVLVADIDHFKAVNDSHGHLVGDTVLRDVAGTLGSVIRSLDRVYRFGGEEFVVLLPGATREEALSVAERVREAVEASTPAGLPVSVSVGAAAARGDDADFGRLLRSADGALYAAKAAGRNRVAFA